MFDVADTYFYIDFVKISMLIFNQLQYTSRSDPA
jgi:hypothetical protein